MHKHWRSNIIGFLPAVLGFWVLFSSLFPMLQPPEGADANQTPDCGLNPQVEKLLDLTSQEDLAGWIARLSGTDPVILAGEESLIQTRYSFAMFRDQADAHAYDYVRSQLLAWYPAGQIEEDPYSPAQGAVWKNLILTLPGRSQPDQMVILSAHLDSISDDPEHNAPGAEDNGSGSAALLEAARIFRTRTFERTLRLIWFTGEEQGMLGSRAYVADHDLSGVIADFNLDMFGYDPNRDGCFEVHAGTQSFSAPLGACFQNAAEAYSPQLKLDYVDRYDMTFSDHSSFWDKNIGALEVLENFSAGLQNDACGGGGEHSPYYHRTSDTLDKLNLETGFAITRASLAAVAGLAGTGEACLDEIPQIRLERLGQQVHLHWNDLPDARYYRVYRSLPVSSQTPQCSADWVSIGETQEPQWWDDALAPGITPAYRVEAIGAPGCVSSPSACKLARQPDWGQLYPWINH